MAEIKASTTFESPINQDDGTKNRFIGNARSVMQLVYHPDTKEGYIDWTFLFLDGPLKDRGDHNRIALYFNDKRLVSFDGVFELPAEAIKLLEDNGFNATFAKV